MPIRQYIGARYVTKIYENSLDPSSAEWEASVNYEPLTLVTYNNGSYLSKKEVLATIGDPATNPSYWVQTGFYNGQIANLQNQITAINALIKTMAVTPEMFGAVGDGATDDTTAIQNAIDFAQDNKCTLLLNNSYVTSTLHISKPLTVTGNGRLKAVPYSYTTLTSSISAGAQLMEVADASKLHVNQFIILINGSDYDVMTVTGINGNTISIEHSPLFAPTVGTNNAYPSGATVEIMNTVFCVTKNIAYDPNDVEADGTAGVSDVTIENIEIVGNSSGYDVNYMNVAENFGGHIILLFRTENCKVSNVYLHDGGLVGIDVLGYSNNNEISGCIAENFTGAHYGPGASDDRLETCACISAHWDTGVVNTDRDSNRLNIHDNHLNNAQVGVFLSATHYTTVDNNIVENMARKGIFLYGGDLAYGINECIISNNVVKNTESGAYGIIINGTSAPSSRNNMCVNNDIVSDIGMGVAFMRHSTISGNYITATEHVLDFIAGSAYLTVKNNHFKLTEHNKYMLTFLASSQNPYLVFKNNTWVGNGAYTEICGDVTVDGDVFFNGEQFIECCRLRLKANKLHVYFCSTTRSFFALNTERFAADVFQLQDRTYYYTSAAYVSGTTTERTDLANNYTVGAGSLFYDTTDGNLYAYNGSAWVAV